MFVLRKNAWLWSLCPLRIVMNLCFVISFVSMYDRVLWSIVQINVIEQLVFGSQSVNSWPKRKGNSIVYQRKCLAVNPYRANDPVESAVNTVCVSFVCTTIPNLMGEILIFYIRGGCFYLLFDFLEGFEEDARGDSHSAQSGKRWLKGIAFFSNIVWMDMRIIWKENEICVKRWLNVWKVLLMIQFSLNGRNVVC